MATETMTVLNESYNLYVQYSGSWALQINVPKQLQNILSEDPGDYNELLVTKEALNEGIQEALVAFRDAMEMLFDGPRSVLVAKVDFIQTGQKETPIT